ncbi:MAG: hypothetical protein KJO82_16245, partial [Gammaproteobacteria bacterium]|nr:hypothetical protein [Gammaproteobacteria bacterium]
SSLIVDAVSAFITSWQRGELLDVDARRKQYHAQYGFPLLVARGWNTISIGDPRTVFPGAFHRLLYEASQYYETQRDRFKTPDVETARSAVVDLLGALREGNENLRKRRTGQIRGQTEYCKRLLGGADVTKPIGVEWSRHLTGRPGITEAPGAKPWKIKADAVASAYGWNRPRINHYAGLAEHGEAILLAVRIAGQSVDDIPALAKPLMELIQPHVVDYVNAFKVVGGEDLGRKYIPAPPAAIMARKVPLPPVPPLKRQWAAITPAAMRNTAA